MTTNLRSFIELMPISIKNKIKRCDDLVEIVLDVGRKPEARYLDNSWEYLDDVEITETDIRGIVHQLQFGYDDRSGIENELHRISCIKDREDNILGLTCRVGRSIPGACDIIKDFIDSGKSILLLGVPGSGKSSKLRDIAKYISNDLNKRTIIVDTSNEIAGYGNTPHESVGRSRRMQVSTPSKQHSVLISAVENHTPQVIIVDELSTRADADAVRTIAERGVQLFATAHGMSIHNLIDNPTLVELIGGVQTVTLSDSQAIQRGCKKSILERKHNPTFDVIVEIIDFNSVAIYPDVKEAVDAILDNLNISPELRHINSDGSIDVEPYSCDYSKEDDILFKLKMYDLEPVKNKSNGNGNKPKPKAKIRG